MSNIAYNVVILVLLALVVTGAGIYATMVVQPKEIERLEQADKVARLRQAEVTALLAEENSSAMVAKSAVQKWKARYKVFPKELKVADVVHFMNARTQRGFKNFDITVAGVNRTPDFSYHTLRINGRGYFNNLYRFIWDVENNRDFYRIRDLQLEHIDITTEVPGTERQQLQVMVSFNLTLDAYFGGSDALSAPTSDQMIASEDDISLPVSAASNDLPSVPMSVLPTTRTEINPFYPLILETVPPNAYGLLDVEQSTLVSIVGREAIFETKDESVTVGVGDNVYLGQIVSVDPYKGLVVARLNRGGIIDEVEIELSTGDLFRQAVGPSELSPVLSN